MVEVTTGREITRVVITGTVLIAVVGVTDGGTVTRVVIGGVFTAVGVTEVTTTGGKGLAT